MIGKGCWLAAGLLVLAAGAWMFYDQPLEAEAQAWLDAVEAGREGSSEAYETLLGLDAPLTQDPRERGRQRLADYAGRASAKVFSDAVAPAPSGLAALGVEALCPVAQAGCFRRLLEDEELAQRLLDEHPVRLQRYRQVLGLSDFRSQAVPGVEEPLPPYIMLAEGNRLLGLQALLLARAGDARATRQLLEEDIAQLRRQLALSDQLVGKMVWVLLIAADLDLLARLRAEGLLEQLSEQPALSLAERDLLPALRREFAGRASLFLSLPEMADAQAEYPPGTLEVFFKPRQSVNLMFAQDRRLAATAALDAAAFAQHLRQKPGQPLSLWRHPNNPIGVILLNVGSPDMNRYIARLHDLDAKLRLYNLVTRLPAAGVPDAAWLARQSEVHNPYQADTLPSWRAQSGELCFGGPLDDPRGLRCIAARSDQARAGGQAGP